MVYRSSLLPLRESWCSISAVTTPGPYLLTPGSHGDMTASPGTSRCACAPVWLIMSKEQTSCSCCLDTVEELSRWSNSTNQRPLRHLIEYKGNSMVVIKGTWKVQWSSSNLHLHLSNAITFCQIFPSHYTARYKPSMNIKKIQKLELELHHEATVLHSQVLGSISIYIYIYIYNFFFFYTASL